MRSRRSISYAVYGLPLSSVVFEIDGGSSEAPRHKLNLLLLAPANNGINKKLCDLSVTETSANSRNCTIPQTSEEPGHTQLQHSEILRIYGVSSDMSDIWRLRNIRAYSYIAQRRPAAADPGLHFSLIIRTTRQSVLSHLSPSPEYRLAASAESGLTIC